MTSAGTRAYAADFVLGLTVFASPWAISVVGFVDLLTAFGFSAGGTLSAATETLNEKYGKKTGLDVASSVDMSPNSLRPWRHCTRGSKSPTAA